MSDTIELHLGEFGIADAKVDLPAGAFAGGRRRMVRHQGRPVLAMTEGRFRSCLHPVWTPAGAVVTAEAPADHPHHNGIWCAADHIHALMPTATGHEIYIYNLYVDDVFQGRSPGTIRETAFEAESAGSSITLRQHLVWRGPREWAAPEGRPLLDEVRTTTVRVTSETHVIDVVSSLTAAAFALEIGPTRHGFFNARISEAISLTAPGGASSADGRRGGGDLTRDGSGWVDWSGPAGHGAEAGLAVLPAENSTGWWFVSDWGVMTTSPFRHKALKIDAGATRRFACRFVAHDGAADAHALTALQDEFRRDDLDREEIS